jgi:hypothetical protein
MAWAIYYSASGGDNDVFGNEIVISKPDLDTKVITSAFYICGGPDGFGGNFYNNTITTNVPAAWIGTMYGGAAQSKLVNNTIIKSSDAAPGFKPFRMGWSERSDVVAKNIEFRSNEIKGSQFDLDLTGDDHSFSVYWTLRVHVVNKEGSALENTEVTIKDKNGKTVHSGLTDVDGMISLELLEYSVAGTDKTIHSPYMLVVGRLKEKIALNKNREVTLVAKN